MDSASPVNLSQSTYETRCKRVATLIENPPANLYVERGFRNPPSNLIYDAEKVY